MNVLIVGSGGREHALAWKVSQSPKLTQLFALPGSAGIAQFAQCLSGNPLDVEAVVKTCRDHKIDLVLIGPEGPLAAGLCDALRKENIQVFGPTQTAARLESSKSFAKEFMRRHHIPTAEFEVFDDQARARNAALHNPLPFVVKADGLAAGKGVRVCRSREDALEAVQDFMVIKTLGAAGERLVFEQCLEGEEASVMVLCDGNTMKVLPVSRDHKRLRDGDAGPNTGGMGAFAPVTFSPDVQRRIQDEILDRVLAGLKAEKLPYCGVLYCGLMLTHQGPMVLEFNARFGDPETQAVLPLVKSDLLELMLGTIHGHLDQTPLELNHDCTICVVMASAGYPEAPHTGDPIQGLELAQAANPDGLLFHAGIRQIPGGWATGGGRVLGVVARGVTLERARQNAYRMVDRIQFDGRQYRTDIGASRAAAPVLKAKGKPEALKKS